MTRAPSALARLDEVAARADCLSAQATFALDEGARWVLRIEVVPNHSGRKSFALALDLAQGRKAEADVWKRRGQKLSTTLRAFAKAFPGLAPPPDRLTLMARGSEVSTPEVERLLLAALAEAYGQSAPSIPSPTSPKPEPIDWPAVLRSGADGIKKWGRLKASERKAVSLAGADLGGLDLAGVPFRGVSAKRASFAGSNLQGAALAEAVLDWADFSECDLRGADLKEARAPEAVFRGANLARASLTSGLFFGSSFAGADLTEADLSDANLAKADLTGATLDGADLDRASFDGQTAWPSGFAIPPEVAFIGRGTDPRLSGKGKKAVATDVAGLFARLRSTIDPKRMQRTLDMLRSGKNQLFAEVEPDHVRGIVRSQREPDLVYSCVLTADGTYACCTPDLNLCMGLRGEPCKHILVLLIGLARAGQVDPAAVDRWVVAATGKNHRWNKTTQNHVSDTLLRYRCVQAGEVDWRPTETIPEDFYAL
jgi:hypothetical protein